MEIRSYKIGETDVLYFISKEGRVSLQLIPQKMRADLTKNWEKKNLDFDARREHNRDWRQGNLVQLHLRHHNRSMGSGMTMKYSESTYSLYFVEQQKEENRDSICIRTILKTSEGYEVIHVLKGVKGKRAFFCETSFVNGSDKEVELEMLSSFCLENLSPFRGENDPNDNLKLHRFRGGWALEGKHICESAEELGLQKAWIAGVPKGEKFGSIGSWPTEKFFPMAAVEDRENGVFWAAALEHNASWMMELTRDGDTFSFSGGIADFEAGAWMKRLKPGEVFTAPRAYITAVKGDMDEACQSLTALEDIAAETYGEQGLPVLFNEFCSSWGKPTQDKVLTYAEKLKGKGIRYLVIDAGWSKGGTGQAGNGEWIVDTGKFPDMKGMNQTLRKMGFIPGIWFEFEVTTKGSPVFGQDYDDMHLKRDGVVIHTGGNRTFWDFTNPWVVNYLSERVIGLLKEYGFGYLKVDYNGNIGLGCDGSESLGEGLRKQMASVRQFFRKIREEIPELIIENCASGGNRTEPSMLGITAMTSFSDAHEAKEIPYIAANLRNLVLPRQNQIWAVLREDDSLERIEYGIAAGFMGRICLSGDVDRLSPEQWMKVEEGLGFYRRLERILINGITKVYGNVSEQIRHPEGTQVVVRKNAGEMLIVCHAFQNPMPLTEIPIEAGYVLKASYGRPVLTIKQQAIIVEKMDEWTAAAAYLVKKVDGEPG